MVIDLSTENVTPKVVQKGDDIFQLTSGKALKIESTPNGEEHFNGTVPEGKTWSVTVFLKIVERNQE